MAKFIFTSHLEKANLSRAGLDADINLTVPDLSLYVVKDVADEDYESVLSGTKVFNISGEEITFTDQVTNLAGETVLPINDSSALVEKEDFKGKVEFWITNLQNKIDYLPAGHSKLNRANETIDFLKAIDFDSLSYPVADVDKYLNDNNKYINYAVL